MTSGSFAGIPVATLQTWLTQAQTARHELVTGRRAQMVAYGQGDGTKTVTYSRSNLADIDAYIASLMAVLGLGRRRAMAVSF